MRRISMKRIKWNYAVVKSVFGDLWIGKTKLEANGEYIFSSLEEASSFACQIFEYEHLDFDCSLEEDDENYDDELLFQFEGLENPNEDELEEIKKGIEKFIVKG
jgi:hypothetical protein